MAEAIVIDAATRAISVPDSEARFGCAGERKIEKKHIHIDGRVVDDTDLGIGFRGSQLRERGGLSLRRSDRQHQSRCGQH